MYTLNNAELTVSVLDPVSDVERLGSRYCTGGYIYQVEDRAGRDLLAGPLYPDPRPDTFDGQGAPDMFHRPLGAESAAIGDAVGCIGVGLVRRTSPIEPFDVRHNKEVIEYVTWQVESMAHTISMETETSFQEWSYRLQRRVTLEDYTIISRTSVQNSGASPLPIRWFPHPFFPLTDDDVLCRFSVPIAMADNPGYFLNDEGYICRKPNHDWIRGWYQLLDHEIDAPGLTIVQKHPLRGEVCTTIDYVPSILPIWGNRNTFSFEPYLERRLAPGEETAWEIRYRF